MKFLLSFIYFFPLYLFAQTPRANTEDTTTLAYTLRKGKLDLHFRLYYMTTQNEKELSDYHAWAVGGGLKYETGSFKGFQFGVGGFFVWNLGSSDLGKPDPTTGAANRYEIGQFDIEDPYNKNDMARLENFYLKYNYRSSNISFGRMVLNTPYINPQDGRMRPSAVQGVWIDFNELNKTKIQGGWLNRMSPRGTVNWYEAEQSIGIYSQGLNLDGTRSNYKGNIKTNGVAVLNLTYQLTPKWNIQAWNYYIDNIVNTAVLQSDGEWRVGLNNKVIGGFQYTHQQAVKDGGNADPRKTYYDPAQQTNIISGRLGIGRKSSRLLFNYTRITADGRYLFPREWGRDPLYTFMKRERSEGMGDVNAFTINLLNDLQKGNLKTEFSYGYYKLPGVTNVRLNKYGMPSYHQFLADLTYDIPGFLKGARLELIYTYKLKAEDVPNQRFVINKVNMHHVNFILNYHL
jgi:hypothetical protein